MALGKATEYHRRQDNEYCAQCEVRHLAICSVLEDGDLAELSAITEHRTARPGEMIFDEGDPSRHLFNVSAGTVRIYKLLPDGRRQITGFLFPGDFLGLASTDHYSYGAEAVTEAQLCRFPKKSFQEVALHHPSLRVRLFERANDELTAAQEQMLLLGRKSPQEKLASFFLRLRRNNIKWGLAPDVLRLDMTREDIADYLGLTVETVSRTFTRFKTSGVIGLPARNRVELLDVEHLEEIAEEASA